MHEVGLYLRNEAHTNSGPHRDAFARSAYNRYYYSCFLVLRSALSEINPSWASLPHNDYSGLLAGKILQLFKKEMNKAKRAEDSEYKKLLNAAIVATKELSRITDEAYAVRVTADYHPEVKVIFKGASVFSLNSINDARAHQWFGRVSNLINDVLRAWRQMNA